MQGKHSGPRTVTGYWSTLLIPWGRWVDYKDTGASPGLAAARMCWRVLGQVPVVLTVSLITSDSYVKTNWDKLSHKASFHYSDEYTTHNFWTLSQIQGAYVSKDNGESSKKSFIKILPPCRVTTLLHKLQRIWKEHNQISEGNELIVLAAGICCNWLSLHKPLKETILVEGHKVYLHRWSFIIFHAKTGWVGYADLMFSLSQFVWG